MKFKAIIFDFDGVLFDSEKIHLQTYNQIFHTLGFTISEAEYFQRYIGLSDSEIFKLIFDEKNINYDLNQIDHFRKSKITAYRSIINHSKSLKGLPHVDSFIKYYLNKIEHFAICSGAAREEIEAILNKLENGKLRKCFKEIITIDDINFGKPSPEGYLLAAKRLNVLPQDCLAIEDTPKGIAAAKNAGMNVVAITTSCDKAILNEADFIADNYNQIDAWVKNLIGTIKK